MNNNYKIIFFELVRIIDWIKNELKEIILERKD